MKKEPSQDIYFYITGWCFIALTLMYLILKYVFHLEILEYIGACTLYKWTGFYCPGCGGTRAVNAILNGDWISAVFFHPFVPYTLLIGTWFMLTQTIEKITYGKIQIALHFRMIYVWIAIALIAINFIWKNAMLILTGVPPM